jgi:hypothetical protein
VSAGSQLDVRALAAAIGLGDHRAAREEARDRAFDRLVQRPPQRYRTYREQMEHGESTRERAERYRVPVTPRTATAVGWGDGCHLPGELTRLSYY